MNMSDIGDIEFDSRLRRFIDLEVMPGTGIEPAGFWSGFAALIRRFTPRNARLLERRDALQAQVDAWHRRHPGSGFDPRDYRRFLEQIGYLVPEGPPFQIATANVDPEIAALAGPQLVVPINNARYALNAANARWGSLYDALYASDVIPKDDGVSPAAGYDRARGARVVAFARDFLDAHFPLVRGSHADAAGYRVAGAGLVIGLADGSSTALRTPTAFIGFSGDESAPAVLLLVHHGLHVEIHVDRGHPVGRADPAGVRDVVLEAALTTIQDCEDSVAAVNVEDKLGVYRNWLGLMQGTLEASLPSGRSSSVRRLDPDRRYRAAAGATLTLPGRSLMMVRHVGQHMLSDLATLAGRPVPETLVDAAVTALIGLHDLRGPRAGSNSRRGSIYVVKPKMHGPEEAAFAGDLFSAVETLLGLPQDTLKIGVMDEERRTTVNLAECIRAVQRRIVFINTGFLDRTGDEIHTCMEAGAVDRKKALKAACWLDAYERQNVDVGLACGLGGRAQIGKGMWAMTERMAAMLDSKGAHLEAGASTSWVPSPTAATIHALNYHRVRVADAQTLLAGRPRAPLADILTPPLAAGARWSPSEVEEELDNNLQSILGYVVRWIDEGIGCSKVPDYYNVALMEDRATLRISSQHVANWLHHDVCSREQVMQGLHRMAQVVDAQNAGAPGYRRLADDAEHNPAFQAARDLVLRGREQANGYTEVILHARRLQRLAAQPAADVSNSCG